jgi:hypothetical protein
VIHSCHYRLPQSDPDMVLLQEYTLDCRSIPQLPLLPRPHLNRTSFEQLLVTTVDPLSDRRRPCVLYFPQREHEPPCTSIEHNPGFQHFVIECFGFALSLSITCRLSLRKKLSAGRVGRRFFGIILVRGIQKVEESTFVIRWFDSILTRRRLRLLEVCDCHLILLLLLFQICR